MGSVCARGISKKRTSLDIWTAFDQTDNTNMKHISLNDYKFLIRFSLEKAQVIREMEVEAIKRNEAKIKSDI